jgi:pilus assembly protein CpaC
MHPNYKPRRRFAAWGLALAAGMVACSTTSAQPQPTPKAQQEILVTRVAKPAKDGAYIVPLNGAADFTIPEHPKDANGKLLDIAIEVPLPGILKVRPKENGAILTGVTAGTTPLVVKFTGKDAGGNAVPDRSYDIRVEPDLELLRQLIKRTVPTAAVEVSPGLQTTSGPVIILSGFVTSPQDATTVERLASGFAGSTANLINAIQIGGVQQVQIDVVVARVDRSQIRQRGFDWVLGGGSGVTLTSLVSGLLGQTNLAAAGGFAGVTPSAQTNIGLGIVPAQFFGALQALRTENLAKFLSEPRVVTQTGRPAFFRVGGQQAILGPASGITGPGVQLVPFGTELEVVPIVHGNGKIFLDINPRISAVSQALGIVVNGNVTPGFTEQTTRVSVELESGQTYAIGGLIENSIQGAASKIPVLGDLPYVGTAFSTIRYQESETELIILVTPRLVAPLDCNQLPKRLPGRETRTPDDYELFLENVLEAPRGQRKVWNGRAYNAPWKCDPTAAVYPCVGNVCNGPNGTCLPASGACSSPAGCLPNQVVGHAAHHAATPAVPAAMPSVGAAAGTPIAPPVTGAPVGPGN